MSRILDFEEDAICEDCNCKGAYDFMGTYLCLECAT